MNPISIFCLSLALCLGCSKPTQETQIKAIGGKVRFSKRAKFSYYRLSKDKQVAGMWAIIDSVKIGTKRKLKLYVDRNRDFKISSDECFDLNFGKYKSADVAIGGIRVAEKSMIHRNLEFSMRLNGRTCLSLDWGGRTNLMTNGAKWSRKIDEPTVFHCYSDFRNLQVRPKTNKDGVLVLQSGGDAKLNATIGTADTNGNCTINSDVFRKSGDHVEVCFWGKNSKSQKEKLFSVDLDEFC